VGRWRPAPEHNWNLRYPGPISPKAIIRALLSTK
jgi:hypothetical protein